MQLVDRRTYRAKTPRPTKSGFVNDRTITYISSLLGFVQYDGPAVANKQKHPAIERQTFLKWASHDVTEQLPGGCYMTWEQYLREKGRIL